VGWANFIPVRVAQPGASGELSVLESRDGIRILSDATAVAGDGVVVFRPEHAQVVASGPAATTNSPSAAARSRASDGPITGDSDVTLGDSSGTASNGRSGAASTHASNTSNGDLPVNTWRARVEKQVYLGSILESHARLGDTLLRVVGVEAPVGSDILLHVPPTRVLFFPEEAAATSGPMDE
ncbi:MAG: hypothetical protein HY329_07095, partial [Chloroflexi bacterium]|nr:hypothetical protein [Chloroflexota bacterium]